MVITRPRDASPRILMLEPNQQLRAALRGLLTSEHFVVMECDSLDQVLAPMDDDRPTVALVAWQSMEGLLAEEHRHLLSEITRRLRLVLMVPRRWARLLETTDLGDTVAGLVAKPFEAEELLEKLHTALATPVESALAKRLTSSLAAQPADPPTCA
jgi:DNA-binding response OmpR family regulator